MNAGIAAGSLGEKRIAAGTATDAVVKHTGKIAEHPIQISGMMSLL